MAKQMIACIYKFSLEKENNKMAKLEGKVALITGLCSRTWRRNLNCICEIWCKTNHG